MRTREEPHGGCQPKLHTYVDKRKTYSVFAALNTVQVSNKPLKNISVPNL